MKAVEELFDRIINRDLLVRRITVVAANVIPENKAVEKPAYEQMDLFTDYVALEEQKKQEEEERKKERRLQQAVLSIQKQFGKNAILKGMNLEEGAMTKERNEQIGGHKA